MPPFRWDLVAPDRLGSLLDGVDEPNLWFLDELVACAGKVLARSGNGRLVFVGRSLDSMFDLLSGAVPERVTRLPFSFARREPELTAGQVRRARELLTSLELSPATLARQPVTFVDVVSRGSTFTELFALLGEWIEETREPWAVIRQQLRFVGPPDEERARQALAEAVSLVGYGRSKEGRRAIVRATDGEPARQESWLRTLLNDL